MQSNSSFLACLNQAQLLAVSAKPGNQLVLAGAGSGKTRVLVHRIAYLVLKEGISPHSILAVTFTNKAANEMRGRIESLMQTPINAMWIGTFHGIAHRLLRIHWQEANLPQTFQIIDSDDQLRLLKRTIKGMGLDEKKWEAKRAQWYINEQKDEGRRPQHIEHGGDYYKETMVAIYQAYEQACARAGLVDFAELLLRSHELWLNNAALLAHYRARFRCLLVDEFQDTNAVQYAWLKVLTGTEGCITAVGDDDQSIYGWRGARVEHIARFPEEFNQTQIIRLEQNYRSTAHILNAANALIDNNSNRMGKKLWTSSNDGEPIYLYRAFNEVDEARFTVDRIKQWLAKGGMRNDIALLYRSNAQSRVLEEAMLQAGIPYRIHGGFRFFDRAEIKDAMAYLRLIFNRDDDAAFDRVINMPPRGIGNRSQEIIRQAARQDKVSLWQALNSLIANEGIKGKAFKGVTGFIGLIEAMAAQSQSLNLDKLTEKVIQQVNLKKHYAKEGGEKSRSRLENLDELKSAAMAFEWDEQEQDLSPLSAFLSHAALEAGETQAAPDEDCVRLMTMHGAKGLEFPLVFMLGIEEGIFPSRMDLDNFEKQEEERRLCYVAITRAMQQLYICYAESRRLYGQEKRHSPSRFIREIPEAYRVEIRPKTAVNPAFYQLPARHSSVLAQQNQAIPGIDLRLGQSVRHPKFGGGIIMNYEGHGSQARVQVNFNQVGSKWLVVAYAKLQALS